MYQKWFVVIFLWAVTLVHSDGQVLFPDLEGQELQEALRAEFTPASKLNLTQAKDTLYLIIDRRQDSVECVYTGLTLDLPDGVDPSQWLFQNGSGINLEHVYPQSKGADEGMPGHSDMHHLYPSRVAVNEARASFPFDEIPDAQTTTWYKDNLSMQSIPAQDIDAYSEARNGAFEPRESVKGNIARAVFYFYTIYQADADAADPDFFPMQREVLCHWHLDDPADDAELMRSAQVASYQDGKENPFVLDCTAALRAWCPELTGCTTGSHQATKEISHLSVRYRSGEIILHISSENNRSLQAGVYDLSGRLITRIRLDIIAGTSEYAIAYPLAAGIYMIAGVQEDGIMQTGRFVVQ